jgi:hypothetical protein
MRQDAANRAQDEAVDLLQEALQAYPPQAHPFRADVPEYELPLGGYLLTLGYATPRQIIVALREQRRRAEQGSLAQLGEILVEQGVIQPQVLAAVLLVQLVERTVVQQGVVPARLGERLVAMELLSPAQLAPAIERQIRLRHEGSSTRLGELLVEQGVLDQQAVEAALGALPDAGQAPASCAAGGDRG